MPEKIDGPRIPINIHKELVARIQKIAKRQGVPRAEAMRIAMEIGADTIEAYGKVYVSCDLETVQQRAKAAIKKDIAPALFAINEQNEK